MKPAATVSFLLTITMIGSGCSSQDSKKAAPKTGGSAIPAAVTMAGNRSHPLAKFIEIGGFRLSEKSPGKVTVEFAVVNHSTADISDLAMDVTLKPVTAKSEDGGFCTFTVKVAALAPLEMKNAVSECPSALRIYELPDWQFIRPTFQITAPAP